MADSQSDRIANRPTGPDQRYRLYIDESGDHVFKHLESAGHRYLCLLGCWLRGDHYRTFHDALQRFKQEHLPHNPDDPVILHREDILNRRGPYWRLRDAVRRRTFDEALFQLIADTAFRIVAIVIDKKSLVERYPTPAHPYHLALGFLMQRYCGLLNHINRCGDVMAESRGGREDRLLKDSYRRVYERGVWTTRADFFQEALTSSQLKVKPKSANIAGLQLADLLGHPVRQMILRENRHWDKAPTPFAERLLEVIESKFNRHLYQDRVEGYGKVFFPEIK